MKHQFRVTQYDPADRNEFGYYIGDLEHLSIPMEHAYINAVKFLINSFDAKSFNYANAELYDGYVIPESFDEAISGVLADECWFKIEHESFFVHFGYDYYMYFGMDVEIEDFREKIEALGLFCEDTISPYFGEGELL